MLEYDDVADDDFTDDTVTLSLAQVGAGRTVTLICTHDASRIDFEFRLEPVFD